MRLKDSVVSLIRFRMIGKGPANDRLRLNSLAKAISAVSENIEDERRFITLRLGHSQAWAGSLVGASSDEYIGRAAPQERELAEAEAQMREAGARLAQLDQLRALCSGLQTLVQQAMPREPIQSAATCQAKCSIG